MRTYPLFRLAIEAIKHDLQIISYKVDSKRWQSVDISDKPEMKMREIFNTSFVVNVDYEKLDYYREDIEPNLPWADDHFEERVGGQPLNPGKEWENWPWSNKADTFRTEYKEVRTPSDWGYLAGLIDGDGCFSVRTPNENGYGYPRLKITQIDHKFLQSVQEHFNVGTLSIGKPSKLSTNESLVWRVNDRESLRWVLKNTLPYLRLKKARAKEMLELLPEGDRRGSKVDKNSSFSHTYMERYWGSSFVGSPMRGIRYDYGDLENVVDHLHQHPESRQAYLPVWFPEDTGVVHGERVPCTLGYHFLRRHGYLHCTYYIRSCDFTRHFRDDLYLSLRLQLWMLDQLRKKDGTGWKHVKPGMFVFHCVSLHIFEADFAALQS